MPNIPGFSGDLWVQEPSYYAPNKGILRTGKIAGKVLALQG